MMATTPEERIRLLEDRLSDVYTRLNTLEGQQADYLGNLMPEELKRAVERAEERIDGAIEGLEHAAKPHIPSPPTTREMLEAWLEEIKDAERDDWGIE